MFNIKPLLFAVAICAGVAALRVDAFAASGAIINNFAVGARAAVVIEPVTGKVIFAQNADAKLPMASTTKIMTALLTLEQPDIDKPFVVDPDAIKVEGTSMGLREGDVVTLRTLAYGMLLPSGNDAANAAAVKISKTVPEFAKLMNSRAKELGLMNTNFVTPSGLDAKGHFTTAYDLAMLAGYALQNPDFLEICSSSRAIISFGDPPYNRYFTNHNRLLKELDGCIGVKTGFTDTAKRCLVSAAERDGVRLVCVTLNCPDDWNTHKKLIETCFSRVKLAPSEAELPEINISVVGGTKPKVTALPMAHPMAYSFDSTTVEHTLKYSADKFLYAPVKRGKVVGSIDVCSKDKIIYSTPLLAAEDIPAKQIEPKQKNIFERAIGRLIDILRLHTSEFEYSYANIKDN